MSALIFTTVLGIILLYLGLTKNKTILSPVAITGLLITLILSLKDWGLDSKYFHDMIIFDNFSIAFNVSMIIRPPGDDWTRGRPGRHLSCLPWPAVLAELPLSRGVLRFHLHEVCQRGVLASPKPAHGPVLLRAWISDWSLAIAGWFGSVLNHE